MSIKKVLIVQWVIKQYRIPFYYALAESLKKDGINLTVVYGKPSDSELKKGDNAVLSESIGRQVNNYWFMNHRLLYQPVFFKALFSDLVIVEQANKHLVNYSLLLLSKLGLKGIAYWGHGRNRQASKYLFAERIKKYMATWAKYWFAYTEGTSMYLRSLGVPENNISVVHNSVDTLAFQEDLESFTDKEVLDWRGRLGINSQSHVGIYCGSLYDDKKISFLLEAAKLLVTERGADFHLLVIGDGEDRHLLEEMHEPWLHYLGPLFGKDKAITFLASDVFLNPGLVGLSILDAFVARLPMVTTDIPIHSPEVEYLKHNYNGIMVEYDTEKYAESLYRLVEDEALLNELSKNAWLSSQSYTIDRMVNCFRKGVLNCLN